MPNGAATTRIPMSSTPLRSVCFERPTSAETSTGSSDRPLGIVASWSPLGVTSGSPIAHLTAVAVLGRVAVSSLLQHNLRSTEGVPLFVRLAMPPPFSGALSLANRSPNNSGSIEEVSLVVVYVALVWRCFRALERRWGSSRLWAFLIGLHVTSLVAAGLVSALGGVSLVSAVTGAVWAVPLAGVVASGIRAAFPTLFASKRTSSKQPAAATTTPIFTPFRVQQIAPAFASAVLLSYTLPAVPAVAFTVFGVAAAYLLPPNGTALMAARRSPASLNIIQRALYVQLAQRVLTPLLRRAVHNLPTPSQTLPTAPVRTSVVTCIQELGYNAQGTTLTEEEEMLYAAQRNGLAVMRPQQMPVGPAAPLQQDVGGARPNRSRSPSNRAPAEVAVPPSAQALSSDQRDAVAAVMALELPGVNETAARNALVVSGWSVDAAVMLLLDNPGGL